MIEALPWHDKTYTYLANIIKQQRIPNALLLTGISNIGKLNLAKRFLQLLLCKQPTQDNACGLCKSCRAIAADDLSDEASQKEQLIRYSLSPNVIYCRQELTKSGSMSDVVRIDQIREFCTTLHNTSQGLKIGLLWYGDQMNAHASDSLLKTLEEPPENTLIILLAHQSNHLSQTILSRVQQIHIASSNDKNTLIWLESQCQTSSEDIALSLEASYGAPLLAVKMLNSGHYTQYQIWQDYLLELANNPNYLSQAKPKDTQLALSCLRDILMRLIYSQAIPNNTKIQLSGNKKVLMNNIVNKTQAQFLFALLEDTNRAIYLDNTNINLNLLLDNILIVWSHITHLAHYPKLTY